MTWSIQHPIAGQARIRRLPGAPRSSGSVASLPTLIAMVLLGCVATWSQVFAQMPGEATYGFRLTQGKGTLVCDAFLKRLQTAKLLNPPYCGIPDNTKINGFAPLHPVQLTKKEVTGLFSKVEWFTYKQNQNVGPYPGATQEVGMYFGRALFAWRYEPPISIGNDGEPENVLVWQGTGLYYDDSEAPCGWPASGTSVIPYRTSRIALALTADNGAIDEQRTKELFGLPSDKDALPGLPRAFRPVGYEMGFFEFRGLTYMDTFGETVGLTMPPLLPRPPPVDLFKAVNSNRVDNTLTVLLRTREKTRVMCRFRVTIVPKEKR